MGLPYDAAIAGGQEAQDDAERHYDEVTLKKEAYADAVAQQRFDAALAQGAPYEEALDEAQDALAAGYPAELAAAEGQAALNAAESDYEAMLADQQAYADAVAQQRFETALAMGVEYEDAVAEGQRA